MLMGKLQLVDAERVEICEFRLTSLTEVLRRCSGGRITTAEIAGTARNRRQSAQIRCQWINPFQYAIRLGLVRRRGSPVPYRIWRSILYPALPGPVAYGQLMYAFDA